MSADVLALIKCVSLTYTVIYSVIVFLWIGVSFEFKTYCNMRNPQVILWANIRSMTEFVSDLGRFCHTMFRVKTIRST